MPQIDLFFDEEDEARFLSYLLREGFSLISNRLYSEPKYEVFSNLDRYYEIKKETKKSIFITHKSYEKCPLEMRQLKKGKAAGKYFIMPRSGGPVFDFFCPGTHIKYESHIVGPSILGYYKTYWNTSLQRTEEVPLAQKEAYKKILKFVKENSVPSEPKGFYVGVHAASEFVAGRVKLINALRYPYSVNPKTLKSKVG